LEVTPAVVTITAASSAGVFYAFQTLRQLLPGEIFSPAVVAGVRWAIPCVTIEDYPRFKWRGLMLDSSRYFMPKAFIKKFIDALALHKMNIFHWHLTDDQGWRLEIKKYPKLTEVGAWRAVSLIGHLRNKPRQYDGRPHGGFYTQEDVRDIVTYAADRHVTVVPEIEMPGHNRAAIAAYPHLGNNAEPIDVGTTWGIEPNILNVEESTILFFQDVLAEVLELFPSQYIHVGGDEAVKDQWNLSPQVQARMKELGLKDVHAMQSYFIGRMDEYLTARGRSLIGWDEILEGGLSPNATVMSWRGVEGAIAAARQGHDCVMASKTHAYFDYAQSKSPAEPLNIGGFIPLSRVYSFDPIPAELSADQAAHVLGVQGQLWTEYMPTPAHVEYMAHPRSSAIAEIAWSPAGEKDFDQFVHRLRLHLERLKEQGIGFRELDEVEL
jgi:hexosaminidase